jgi:hypothetical protein
MLAGLYRNYPDEQSRGTPRAFHTDGKRNELGTRAHERKVLGAQQALEAGVRRVTIAERARRYTDCSRFVGRRDSVYSMNTTMLNVQAIEDNHTSGVYPKRPLTLVRGEGCYVWDDAGNRYFDMTSGQGVALLGHCHPAISAAINQQAQQLITCPEIFYNDQRAKLYEALMTILPEGLDRFFLCNSGAEAMEGALKAARLLTGRSGVVAMRRGFSWAYARCSRVDVEQAISRGICRVAFVGCDAHRLWR